MNMVALISVLLLCACAVAIGGTAQKGGDAKGKLHEEHAPSVPVIFAFLDTNKDGYISKSEFQHPDFHVEVLNLSWPYARSYININGSVGVGDKEVCVVSSHSVFSFPARKASDPHTQHHHAHRRLLVAFRKRSPSLFSTS